MDFLSLFSIFMVYFYFNDNKQILKEDRVEDKDYLDYFIILFFSLIFGMHFYQISEFPNLK